VISSKR